MAGNKTRKMRLFFRFLLKALTVRRGRVLTALLSIALGASVVAAMSLLYFDISLKMSQELRSYGPNFFIGPAGSVADRMISDETLEEALDRIPQEKLKGYSPYLYGIVRLGGGNAVLTGADLPALRKLASYWQVEGQWVSVGFDERNCMVGASLAKNMELEVGQTVTLTHPEREVRRELRIKGIIHSGEAEDRQVFVNLSLARKILGVEGRVHHAMLSVMPRGLDVEALAARLEEEFPGLSAKPIRKISYSEGKILDRIEGLMALVTLIILLTTTLCVMTSLTAIVTERTPEIGLMKALGAENASVALHFLSEILLICLVGVAAGLVGGFVLAQVLGYAVFGSSVSFRPVVVPITLGISVVSALIAAVLPIKAATDVVPARVLRGEA